ncbi:PTS glucose transporter subunit IIA [Clostridium carboxidivorans P7]|uniref:PTS system, glucose subfamily, IIA subunit n=1 Tax=Clostridium carboxidivorans P7 TaxID=536227 RepID=C6PN99_9CLOT|nr:PTS glucose transporter subunit IIA [Clostridium carboxidivorans]AKN33612.1 PTS glucose transporter subunit IIA [Clostridium carboxidivorans P7]EET89220.1 PTS system, glucose subfamily, IIA subunit [Clostridium carboxidivorans P7]EFG86799.1 putative glucose-specific phosphotransferase enzyme IIA component [Clostridium carboxidivorans P7]
MFDLLKKDYSVISPASGKVLELSEVPDEVFANKLAGDGVAIDCSGDTIVSPADGVLTIIFKTNHAFAVTLDNGVEILVHIGIDTIQVDGEGFQRIAKEGSRVKAGDPIIKIDREIIKEKGFSLITPVLIVNGDRVKNIDKNVGVNVSAGEDIIFTYKTK